MGILALGLKFDYYEKHITLDRSKKGVDYFSSVNPDEFKKFVKVINKCKKSFGLHNYHLSKNEFEYRNSVKNFG